MTPDAAAEMLSSGVAPCGQQCKVESVGLTRTLLCEHKEACTLDRPDSALLASMPRRRAARE